MPKKKKLPPKFGKVTLKGTKKEIPETTVSFESFLKGMLSAKPAKK